MKAPQEHFVCRNSHLKEHARSIGAFKAVLLHKVYCCQKFSLFIPCHLLNQISLLSFNFAHHEY